MHHYNGSLRREKPMPLEHHWVLFFMTGEITFFLVEIVKLLIINHSDNVTVAWVEDLGSRTNTSASPAM